MPKVRVGPNVDGPVWQLTQTLTQFVNVVFGRKLGTSRALHDAVQDALDSSYTPDELRLAFWTVAGISGDFWLRRMLRSKEVGPEIVLRFKGGMNVQTGKPAKRWLDEMISRVGETSPELIGAVLSRFPEEMRAEEQALLERARVEFHG